jgi:hypothetical protein
MGDPVTTGILIGAAMGGGTAAVKGQDPLKGALIGGATGGIGGGFAGGFSGAANPTVGSFAPNFMSTGAVTQSAGAAPTFMQQLSGGAMGVKDMFSNANTFMNQNPTTSKIGMQLVEGAFAPEQPMPYAPAGQIQRGQSAPPMDYMSLLNPQNQSVIRPPQISLLG